MAKNEKFSLATKIFRENSSQLNKVIDALISRFFFSFFLRKEGESKFPQYQYCACLQGVSFEKWKFQMAVIL